MNILLFFPSKKGTEEYERKLMDNLPKVQDIQISRTINGLHHRLRQTSCEAMIGVLLASDLNDLKDLVAIGDLLSGIPLILILPDRDKKTTCLGHRLFPRFIGYADSDFSDVGAVLKRMITNILDRERTRLHQLDGMTQEELEGCQ